MIRFNIIDEKNVFEEKLSEGVITNEQISFIKDSKEIYTHGQYFSGEDYIIIKKVISDSEGKIEVPLIDKYMFLEAVAFNNGLPLNVVRFGDYFYVGYYGGMDIPNPNTAVSLMFTVMTNYEVTLFYIKNTQS